MQQEKKTNNMPEIINLGMYDEEYLQLIAQGRDPVEELLCERQLILAGVSPEDARQVVPLLKKIDLSINEEALIEKVWQWLSG